MKKRYLFLPLGLLATCLTLTPRVSASEIAPSGTQEVVESTPSTSSTTEVTPSSTTEFAKKSYVLKTDKLNVLVNLTSTTECEFVDLDSNKTTKATYTLSDKDLVIKFEDKETYNLTINDDNTLKVKETTTTVTIADRANDFMDKWFQIFMSVFGGAVGSGVIVLLCQALVKRLSKRLESGIDLTNDERKKLVEDIAKYKEIQEEYSKDLKSSITEIKDMIPEMKSDFESLLAGFEEQAKELKIMKDLVCKLVASTPTLASNGYATEIIELLGGFNREETKEVTETSETSDTKAGGNDEQVE